MVFQDPYRLAQSAHDGRRDALAEPLRDSRHRPRRRGRRADRRDCWTPGRPAAANARPATRTSSPAASASASASPARCRCEPELHRRRRAGVGARRLDPGADHQPAAGPAERVRPHLPLHRPRSRRGAPRLRPRRGDVSRQAGRDRAEPRRSIQRRAIPTRKLLLRSVPVPDPKAEAERRRNAAGAEVVNAEAPEDGCPFAARCPRAKFPACATAPALTETASDHQVACHFA